MKINKFFSSKIKLIFVAILLTIFASLTASQLGAVKAQEVNNEFNPITSPISYFVVRGHAYYVFLGNRYPANNVKVRAKNTSTKQEFITYTNERGVYRFSLQQGVYKLFAVDSQNRFFDPYGRIVDVNENKLGINFRLKVDTLPQ